MNSVIRFASMLIIAINLNSAAVSAPFFDYSKIGNLDRVDENILVPMRDGVRLSTYVFYPQQKAKTYPVILLRSPYYIGDETRWWAGAFTRFLKEGYVVVLQNERGKYWSEGTYTFLAGAKNDGYDTIDWIAHQSWSSGNVGTFGCSSTAENQLPLMTMAHPAHKAAIPMSAAAAIGKIGPYYEQGLHYRGGSWQMLWAGWYIWAGSSEHPKFPKGIAQADATRLAKYFDLHQKLDDNVDYARNVETLPLTEMVSRMTGTVSDYENFVSRTPGDPRWKGLDYVNEGDRIGVPGLWIGSWNDTSRGPDLMFFDEARKNALNERGKSQYMVMGANYHCQYGRETADTIVGERSFGDARFAFEDLWIDWFDYWLKGKKNGVLKNPVYRMYMTGENKWKSYDVWPSKNAKEVRFYFDSDGHANSRLGDGRLVVAPGAADRTDTFIYDPETPTRSPGKDRGKFVGLGPQLGSYDNAEQELRADMLVYTSAPLASDMIVSGGVNVTLYVSSDAKDTDFTFRLMEVLPDGKSYNVVGNIQRARYREGYKKEVWMEKGDIYKLDFAPEVTNHRFAAGNRIRIEVASSDVPYFERNLNTGGRNFDETVGVIARNSIHHSVERPSHISFSVVAN